MEQPRSGPTRLILTLALLWAAVLAAPTGASASPAQANEVELEAASGEAVPSARKPKRPNDETSRSLPRAGSPAASQAYARAMIAQRYGWGAGQFSCLKALWARESGWKYWVSNPNGRYHGIPQTSSAVWSKYGYTSSQYRNSPEVQVKVGAAYIRSRYGSPCAAWSFWRGHHWY